MGRAGIRDTVADFLHEEALQRDGYGRIAGIDEAGRGPWAGPVVAAAVVFEAGAIPDGLDDSKRLSAARREELYSEVLSSGDVGVGIADVARIDSDNILNATLWAMAEAAAALQTPCDHALIDGNRAPVLPCPARTLVGGDAISVSIAAASIVAKVTRDRIMTALAREFPDYGFERHKGYGTPAHKRALDSVGPCPHHRQSFAPVRAALARQLTR